MAASQWSFMTATAMSAALKAKKISAVELADHVIAPHRAHDGKINAVWCAISSAAREAARAADAALARGETGRCSAFR